MGPFHILTVRVRVLKLAIYILKRHLLCEFENVLRDAGVRAIRFPTNSGRYVYIY